MAMSTLSDGGNVADATISKDSGCDGVDKIGEATWKYRAGTSGEWLDGAITTNAGYTYRAEFTLTAEDSYTFTGVDAVNVTSGWTAEIVKNTGNTLTVGVYLNNVVS